MPEPDRAAEQPGRVVPPAIRPHVAIISGLSGAGKTTVSKLLEDVGYTVVDNLPAELLGRLAEMIVREPGRFERLALVLDARSGDPEVAFAAATGALEGRGIQPQVFFLEARDDVTVSYTHLTLPTICSV